MQVLEELDLDQDTIVIMASFIYTRKTKILQQKINILQ